MITVPEHQQPLVRALKNGNAAGSGLRLYIPRVLSDQHGLEPGDYYEAKRLQNGRIRLTRVHVDVKAVETEDTGLFEERIALHVTQKEAEVLEAFLVTQDRSQRDVLLGLAKRLRRRMRLRHWPTPDRTETRVEGLP